MNPSTILLMLLYSGALVFIIYFIVQRYRPTPIIIQQVPVTVYPESVWWPWSTGSYNSWPYWTGWWSGGSNGGYGYRGRGYRGGGNMHRMDGRVGGGRMDGRVGGGRVGGGVGRVGGGGGGRGR